MVHPTLPEKPDEAMVTRYREDGYLAFYQGLTREEVRYASEGINQLVHKHAFNEELTEHITHGEGTHGMLFKSRTSGFQFQAEGNYEARADRLDELADNLLKFQSYDRELPIYNYIAHHHPRLRALLSALLGHDYQPYSSMALCRPPGIGATKPWHQDLAYLSVNRFDGLAGVWIALDPAMVDNGCMHVIPGGHRTGPRPHYWSKVDCEITTGTVHPAAAVAVELPPGGLIIFDGLLPHETPANRSSQRRRALQFHYRSAATQVALKESYA